ncbi:3-deoxy-D-manno-octulosonic acid transferase [Azospirillum rugosum]|uniref:3-deoxy-D-manno-octulosonic acid transferase n=1 Tax=Azospirillum rugosum TaxID=416170 RepID=A0ABS4SRX3_9PROT|nr:3-deoxy-D-manno-octulosonic acid transferase [Azospirillum rugosum]MBP2294848.1 3-deoxy-D-manno-octulosonic-acid transferase [Azospirillum rugosum]MDQ0528230.1 3-deoxy-D-manno-octulosonic-acid transferase [Azospirillum rugosum]
MLQSLYRGLTTLAGPAVRLYLDRRRAAGKEDSARQAERFGAASRTRPAGRLAWIHAASVGEANSVLVLVDRLLDRSPDLTVLMTTGTVTSAQLMGRRLPARAIHQYVPVDLPDAVNRFLDHWRPDVVLWTESEIWPNLLAAVRSRGIPAALVNARMSERSFARWRYASGLITPLLSTFQVTLAQSEGDAERLRKLGARAVASVGNLKFSAEPPPARPDQLAALREACAGRPVWLHASTHPGEDEVAAAVHEALATRLPGLLTIIAPRHANRGADIAALMRARGLAASRRSEGALPDTTDAVYIADTMGELGLFYRLAPVVCMGGSFVPHGGQNPVEPAQLGCAVLYGPHMWNFDEITRQLESAGGALPLADAAALTEAVGRLLADHEARGRIVAGAASVTDRNRRIVDRALEVLDPVLGAGGIRSAA